MNQLLKDQMMTNKISVNINYHTASNMKLKVSLLSRMKDSGTLMEGVQTKQTHCAERVRCWNLPGAVATPTDN